MTDAATLNVPGTPTAKEMNVHQDDVILISYRRKPSREEMESAARVAQELFPRHKALIIDEATSVYNLSDRQMRALGYQKIA